MSAEPIMWSPGVTLEAIERQAILHAWQFYRENKSQTASALGIAVRTLETKLQKYGEDDNALKVKLDERKKEREAFLARSRGQLIGTHVQGPVTVAAAPTAKPVEATPSAKPVEAVPHVDSAKAGVRSESSSQPSAKPPVSVPQRPEVQTVLPQPASAYSAGKRR